MDRRAVVRRSGQRVSEAVATLLDRVRRWRVIGAALEVVAEYDRAGGGLVAAGLAYEALFALVPALLLGIGAVGLLLDPGRATAVARAVGVVAPPLESLAVAALDEVRRGAVAFSGVGILGLAWGASRLYRALDSAIGRIFRTAPQRSTVGRAVRGLVAVAGGLAGAVGLAVLLGVVTALQAGPLADAPPVGRPLRILLPSVLGVIGLAALAAAVYRWVPTRHVPWSALGPPAIGVGLAIAAFSQLFAILAPRLIGVGVLVGSAVGLLAALIWLGFVFQVLLLGAAWTRRRLGGAARDGAPEGRHEGSPSGS